MLNLCPADVQRKRSQLTNKLPSHKCCTVKRGNNTVEQLTKYVLGCRVICGKDKTEEEATYTETEEV